MTINADAPVTEIWMGSTRNFVFARVAFAIYAPKEATGSWFVVKQFS
jgi:hypothetical protein